MRFKCGPNSKNGDSTETGLKFAEIWMGQVWLGYPTSRMAFIRPLGMIGHFYWCFANGDLSKPILSPDLTVPKKNPSQKASNPGLAPSIGHQEEPAAENAAAGHRNHLAFGIKPKHAKTSRTCAKCDIDPPR